VIVPIASESKPYNDGKVNDLQSERGFSARPWPSPKVKPQPLLNGIPPWSTENVMNAANVETKACACCKCEQCNCVECRCCKCKDCGCAG